MEQNERVFKEYLKSKLDQGSFASEYLKSGLSSDLNLGGMLTPEVFKQYFLVERKGFEAISSRIHDLFRSNTHNLLCIESERGSGKSTFVNTMHLAKDKKYIFEYPYPYIDMTKRNTYNRYCEDTISTMFYERLSSIDASTDWHRAFFETANRVLINGNDTRSIFMQRILSEAINACNNRESFENFILHHDNRVEQVRDCDIKVFLLLYLLALATKPKHDHEKETRWIIVFDGIEAFVTRDAEDVAIAIDDVHRFIESAFESVGLKDSFFTKFTFVIPIRTATSLNFQNSVVTQGRNIWGNGNTKENIIKLPRSYFSLEALLKKLYFFKELDLDCCDVKNRQLFSKCIDIVSLLIPYPNIIKYLNGEMSIKEAIGKLRSFAEQHLLPLLNNDHRSLVDKICDFSSFDTNPEYNLTISSIEDNIQNHKCQIKYASNGEAMMVFRNMFDKLYLENVLDSIGYSDLDNTHQPGVTRTMLNFLYYKEWYYRLHNINQNQYGGEYRGVAFNVLLDMLKPFAENDIKQLSLVLFRISALNATSKLASYWTNLIIIRGLENRLDEAGFEEIIRSYYDESDNTIQRTIRNWRVKLSDAGACFSSWASKQFEFLLSRCNNDLATVALFAYDVENNFDGIVDACNKVLEIIRTEAIDKLINGCLQDCILGNSERSISHCKFDNNLLECSLFQRYQECLLIIVDSIDYIDRFRIYVLEVSKNTGKSLEDCQLINNALLDIIAKFNSLYEELKNKIEAHFSKSDVFFKRMYDQALECGRLYKAIENRSNPSNIEIDILRRLRQPRSTIWYLGTRQEMEQALKKSRDNPLSDNSLYSILSDSQY